MIKVLKRYYVACDVCEADAPVCDTEKEAIRYAEEEGYEISENGQFCKDHRTSAQYEH